MHSRTSTFSEIPHSKPKPGISAVFAVSIRFWTEEYRHQFSCIQTQQLLHPHNLNQTPRFSFCLSTKTIPWQVSHLAVTEQTDKNAFIFLLLFLLFKSDFFFYHFPSGPFLHPQCWPALSHLFVSLEAAFPSNFPLLHHTLLPSPLPAWSKITGEVLPVGANVRHGLLPHYFFCSTTLTTPVLGIMKQVTAREAADGPCSAESSTPE